MKLKPAQLAGQALAPVYLICGDEPLLVEEAGDVVRQLARDEGFTERQVMFADKRFDWAQLLEATQSLSLFAEKRLFDVRVQATLTPSDQKVVKAFCADPPPDTVLLLSSGRQDPSRGWAKVVEQAGAAVQIWPVRTNELPGWLRGRCRDAGVQVDKEAFALLIERVEGNLLAARQEIARLQLLGDGQPWTRDRMLAMTADSSRFDAFAWVDALFAGDARRASRILDTLQAEGTAPLMILGALNSQLRRIASAAGGSGNVDARLKREGMFGDRARAAKALLARVPAEQLQAVQARLVEVDHCVKGAPGNPWVRLSEIGLAIAAP